MKKLNWLPFIICITILLAGGSIASGQCVSGDGNDTAADAQFIGMTETASGWVCPDDPFDFYMITVPGSAEVISGNISLTSPQVSTVLRLENAASGERIISDWSTNESRDTFTYPVSAGELPSGEYILRVSFWSDAAYDHEYILMLDLTIDWTGDCIPDGNEDPEDASEIAFGEEIDDWVCEADHLDIYRFSVSSDNEAMGNITLTANPGEITLYVYDSSSTEIFRSRTADGSVIYDLGDAESPMAYGDYYIGVLLPLTSDTENSYTLSLDEYVEPLTFPGLVLDVYTELEFIPSPSASIEGLEMAPMHAGSFFEPPKAPWRMARGGQKNTGTSSFSGPGDSMLESAFYLYDYDEYEVRNGTERYGGLLAGANGRVVWSNLPDDLYYVYNLNVRRLERFDPISSPSNKPPALDAQGNFYFINDDGKLVCCSEFGTWYDDEMSVEWEYDLPGSTYHMAVDMIANKVYASYNNNGFYITALTLSGGEAWTYGPFDSPIAGTCEDGFGTAYIQTEQSLYKFNTTGGLAWQVELPSDGRALRHKIQPPIIDRNGRIRVDHALTDYWYIYHPDGYYIGTSWYYDVLPIVTCFGVDGRKYQVNGSSYLYCYEASASSPMVWGHRIEGDVKDMVMDRDNNIYLIYRHTDDEGHHDYRLETVDPETGDSLHTEIITNIGSYICELNLPVELAIGPDEKILVLHAAGYFYAFGPGR